MPSQFQIKDVNGYRDLRLISEDGTNRLTLELVRNMKADGRYDKAFVPGHDLYMWVAVFDHTQTRHASHNRPVRVVTEK